MNVSRRDFFRQFIQRAQQPPSVPRTTARPPTAVREEDFILLCDGCGECTRICSNGVIRIHDGKAELDLHANYCSLCHLCQDVCPTQALSNSVSDSAARPLITSSCNPDMAFYCGECQFHCPSNAITISKNHQPLVDLSLCSGCNQCGYHCPASAIKISINNQPASPVKWM